MTDNSSIKLRFNVPSGSLTHSIDNDVADDPNTSNNHQRTVAIALFVSGLLSYGFLILPARTGLLDPISYGPFAALWFVIFTIGSGLLVPIEQELTRAVAGAATSTDRNQQATAGFLVGLVPTAALAVLIISQRELVTDKLLAGSESMVPMLLLALPALLAFEVIRGSLAGSQLFGRYAIVLISDSAIRFGVALFFVALATSTPSAYGLGLSIGMASAAIIGFAGSGLRLVRPRPGIMAAFITRFGPFAASQLLAQVALNLPVLLALTLAGTGDEAVAGRIGSALVLVRTPLYLLPAMTAPLLPQLVALVKHGHYVELHRKTRRLAGLFLALTIVGAALAASVGPFVNKLLFGDEFALAAIDLALLTAGAGLFAAASMVSLAMLALGRSWQILGSWTIGVACGTVTGLVVSDLVTAATTGFLIACAVGFGLLLVALFLPRPEAAEPAPTSMPPTGGLQHD